MNCGSYLSALESLGDGREDLCWVRTWLSRLCVWPERGGEVSDLRCWLHTVHAQTGSTT